MMSFQWYAEDDILYPLPKVMASSARYCYSTHFLAGAAVFYSLKVKALKGELFPHFLERYAHEKKKTETWVVMMMRSHFLFLILTPTYTLYGVLRRHINYDWVSSRSVNYLHVFFFFQENPFFPCSPFIARNIPLLCSHLQFRREFWFI